MVFCLLFVYISLFPIPYKIKKTDLIRVGFTISFLPPK